MSMTTLVFIGLAAFLIWKLYEVLGSRTGHEKPPHEMNRAPKRPQNDNVIHLPRQKQEPRPQVEMPSHPDLIDDEVKFRWIKFADEGSELAKTFDAIAAHDNSFHPRDFLDGAKMAYEMIVTGFASGDKASLKPLLSEKVYEGFSAAIDSREAKGHKTEMTFIGVQNIKITDAKIDDKEIMLTTRISSESITTTLDEDGQIVDGDPNTVDVVLDIWSFAKPINSSDPSWYLVATRAG